MAVRTLPQEEHALLWRSRVNWRDEQKDQRQQQHPAHDRVPSIRLAGCQRRARASVDRGNVMSRAPACNQNQALRDFLWVIFALQRRTSLKTLPVRRTCVRPIRCFNAQTENRRLPPGSQCTFSIMPYSSTANRNRQCRKSVRMGETYRWGKIRQRRLRDRRGSLGDRKTGESRSVGCHDGRVAEISRRPLPSRRSDGIEGLAHAHAA